MESSQIVSDPSVIDFGIGQPQLDLLPRDLLWQASQTLLAQNDNRPLNYGHPQGDGRFRAALATFLAPAYGHTPDPSSLIASGGASQALSLIAQVFAQPGDTILVEEPAYFLAHQIFRDRGLKIVGVSLRPEGLDLKALERAVKKHKPKFFYTIPAFQNPTGQIMSEETRQEVLRLAQKHNFLIVADEVYQLLYYRTLPPPPFASFLDSELVLSVGSFSKILAPGLRLGWIQAEGKLKQQILSQGLFKSGGGLNHYASCLIGVALSNGSHHHFTERLRRIYAHRVDVMDHCLQKNLSDVVTYQKPTGGYFFWLELAKKVDASELLDKARHCKTGFRVGRRFSCRGKLKNYLRLSFAHYNENALDVGIERLAKVLKT